MRNKKILGYVLAVAIASGVAGTAVAQQNKPATGTQPQTGQSGKMTGSMEDRCKQMMSMHSQMMADLKAMDATLDQKVAAMNSATGNAKVNAMAAVITEMVSQRKQMMGKMSAMRDQMMAHMGEHMAQSGGGSSMADCPMMKEMAQPQ